MWPRIDTSSYESSRRWIGEKQKGKAQDVESGRGIWPEGNPGFVSFHRGNEGSGDVVGGVVSGVDRGPWTVDSVDLWSVPRSEDGGDWRRRSTFRAPGVSQ